MSFDMVAILGRGIQRLAEKAPVEKTSSWSLTDVLEVCDSKSGHLPVRVPSDDDNPLCMVGGCNLNLKAGLRLIWMYAPKIVVCAYGGRSEYLESIGGPSESEVIGGFLHRQLLISSDEGWTPPRWPQIIDWPRTCSLPVPSNTRQELLNIFDLALKHKLTRIALVTVGVHVPRTATYIAKHLSVYEKYRELSPVLFESEEVLLAADRTLYGPRVEALRKSKSYARNWEREAVGISRIVREIYGDAKPKVEVVAA